MRPLRTRSYHIDRDEITAYIARDNPAAALNLIERIEEQIDRLADYPELGRPGRVEGTRELVIANTSYLVIYRQAGRQVLVVRLLHAARRWPEMPGNDER